MQYGSGIWLMIGCAGLAVAPAAMAKESAPAPTVAGASVTATVVAPPPCVINDGRTIDIDFGKVGMRKTAANAAREDLSMSGRWAMRVAPGASLLMMVIAG